jgi:hypothetical protein
MDFCPPQVRAGLIVEEEKKGILGKIGGGFKKIGGGAAAKLGAGAGAAAVF